MSLTDEQAAAARADEDSVAVVAGAGTGKTRVLTERYLHLVSECGVRIERILALTFTDKAAREMKERIRAALAQKGRRDLAHAAEFAPISTIHAFLARVLRERALDAGVDPRFVIADEVTAELLLEQALEETVDGLEPGPRALLSEVAGAEDFLLSLYKAARSTPHEMRDLVLARFDAEDLGARVRRFCESCAGQSAGGKTGERLVRIAGLRERLGSLDPAASVEFLDCVKGGVAKAQAALFQTGRELAREYSTLQHGERARVTAPVVVDALARLDSLYTERKRGEGLLDFTDLERVGLTLLRSPAGAEIAAEFDDLLVDEYQDTSSIQAAILERLAGSCRRFGVGDAKQSIYRFRYADASVFRDLQRQAACFPLGGSFRSRPEVVAFLNELFRELFAGTGVDPQDLRAAAEWRDKEGASVELLAAEGGRAAAARRREAQALARRLRVLVSEERLLHTRADREQRPLTYGDCALLLRATTNLAVYERALAEEGVPYVVVKGRGYYAAREVVDLAHLLALLGDPRDRFRATAVLTSLLCGVPDGDLLHLPGEGPLPLRALDGQRPDAIPLERWERLREFGERFLRWRELARYRNSGDLVETILEETRLPELLLLEPDGRRRHANLRKALRLARSAREDASTHAAALLEFRERELRESEAPITTERDEAVKIMTVHAAKGLQFPLVAVADLAAARNERKGAILHPDGAFGLRLRDGEETAEPPGYRRLRDWDRDQESAERVRLLYVAMTRAEEHLVLSAAGYSRADRTLVGLLQDRPWPGLDVLEVAPLLEGDGRRRQGAAVRAAIRREADLPAGLARDEAGADALLERLSAIERPRIDATPYVAAAADLVEFERCPRRYRLGRMLGIEIEGEPESGFGERPDADEHPRRALGSVFHEIMREIGPGAVPDEETVRRHMPEARAGDVGKLREWAAWFADSELARRLANREDLQSEMPFLTRVEGLAVRGVIDLYCPSLPLLLDYKTGSKVRVEEYRAQITVYLSALGGLGLPVPRHGHLVYVDAQQVIEVAAEPVGEIVSRFRAAHKGDGDFPPRPGDACRYCDFETACVKQGVACPRRHDSETPVG